MFFFSSRRRHTRFSRDWSSDVCSSDLGQRAAAHPARRRRLTALAGQVRGPACGAGPGRQRDRHAAHGACTGGDVEIGRASCREREEITINAITNRKQTKRKENKKRRRK